MEDTEVRKIASRIGELEELIKRKIEGDSILGPGIHRDAEAAMLWEELHDTVIIGQLALAAFGRLSELATARRMELLASGDR